VLSKKRFDAPKPVVRFGQGPDKSETPEQTRMKTLADQYPVVAKMFELVDIPSATAQDDAAPDVQQAIALQMKRMKAKVVQSLLDAGVQAKQIEQNELGSLIVRIPASPGLEHLRPLMLTAHLDIVAGNKQDPTKPVVRRLVSQNSREYITSDGTTTLGADDKGGLAMILENVKRLQSKPHCPLEIIFSPDEESSCDSLRKLDTTKFKAKHAIVVDEFYEFQATNGLASSMNIKINVQGTQGGHSGENIGDPNVLNAIEVLDRLTRKIKTGVMEWHPQYPKLPLISKNLGIKTGGEASNAIPEQAFAYFLMRSFDKGKQDAEVARIQKLASNMERYYKRNQPASFKINIETYEDYPAWQGDPNSILPGVCQKASEVMKGPQVKVEPTHAAAQASILANMKNAFGETFDAVLVGPHIEEAHTKRERIDWQSLVRADQWLGHIIDEYTKKQVS
jgi:tripeptide aminopeptidase